ncbi:hypothetical protein JHK87_004624 [Glycine soja]|nr:hypothetical protein JHK87_004624 [Glycine soja]
MPALCRALKLMENYRRRLQVMKACTIIIEILYKVFGPPLQVKDVLFEFVRKTQDEMFFFKNPEGMWIPCGPKQQGAIQTSMQELAAKGLGFKWNFAIWINGCRHLRCEWFVHSRMEKGVASAIWWIRSTVENVPLEEVFQTLRCDSNGLTTESAEERLVIFGHNKLEEKKWLGRDIITTVVVIGLSGGKRLLSSSYHYSDIIEKLSYGSDFGSTHYQIVPTKSLIVAKKSSNYTPTFPASNQHNQFIKALKKHVDDAPTIADPWFQSYNSNDLEVESSEMGYSLEALLLLQKSMLEKQWNLSFEKEMLTENSKLFQHLPQYEYGTQLPNLESKFFQIGSVHLTVFEKSKVLKFLGFMWNPLSWVMEVAAIMANALANGGGKLLIGKTLIHIGNINRIMINIMKSTID